MNINIDEIDFNYGTKKDTENIFRIIEKGDIDLIVKIFEQVNQCFYFNDFQFNIASRIYDFFEKNSIYNLTQYQERIVESVLYFLTKTIKIPRSIGGKASEFIYGIILVIREKEENTHLLNLISETLFEYAFIYFKGVSHSGGSKGDYFRPAFTILENLPDVNQFIYLDRINKAWSISSYMDTTAQRAYNLTELKTRLYNVDIEDYSALRELERLYISKIHDGRGKIVEDFFKTIGYIPTRKAFFYIIQGEGHLISKEEFEGTTENDIDYLSSHIKRYMETMKRDSRRIYNLIHFFARVYEEKAKRLLRVIFSDSIFYKYDWKQDQELEEYRKKDQLVYDNLVDFLKSEKLWKDTKS